MWYELGADALLVLHFLWIVFLVAGLPWGLYLKWNWLRLLHAAGLIFALILQITNTYCPLTIWEEYLRRHQQPDFNYRGSFIITYVEKLVYPGWISFGTITVLTALLVGATILSFVLKPVWFCRRQQKKD